MTSTRPDTEGDTKEPDRREEICTANVLRSASLAVATAVVTLLLALLIWRAIS